MPANMKWAKKAYKYGGKTVPGMYKGSDLPKAQSNLDWKQLFENSKGNIQGIGPAGQRFPTPVDNTKVVPAPTNPGQKTNWFERMGRRIGNIFRSDDKDVNIWRKPIKNWIAPPAPDGTAYGKRGGSLKRGGSTGPNGML